MQSTRLSQSEFKPLFISCSDLMNGFNTFVCLTGLVSSQHMNLFSCTLQGLVYCCTKGNYTKSKKYQKPTLLLRGSVTTEAAHIKSQIITTKHSLDLGRNFRE